MIRSSRYHYGFSASRESLLGAWSGALLLHIVAVAALVFGWPQAREMLDRIAPIEIRLLTPEKPPEPPPPPPPPPKKAAPPAAPQLLPIALPLPVEAPPPPVVVAAASSAPTTFFVPPAPLEKPAPPAEPQAVSMPAAPEPLIEARFDADYLSNPKPVYPNASRRLGEEGVVHLRVRVSAEGAAERVELKKSSGFSRLDEAARETVARWQFVPARRGHAPVVAWVVVPIIFSLN